MITFDKIIALKAALAVRWGMSRAGLWKLYDKVMAQDQSGCWACEEQEYAPVLIVVDGEERLICEACASELEP